MRDMILVNEPMYKQSEAAVPSPMSVGFVMDINIRHG